MAQTAKQPEFQFIPSTLNFLGMDLQVEGARWNAGLARSVALIGLGVILYPIIQSWRESESNQIKLQHHD
jgi:hypothetical protein